MIKLLRTHPRHLAGAQVSSGSPRLFRPGSHGTESFARMFQDAVRAACRSEPAVIRTNSAGRGNFTLLNPTERGTQYPTISTTFPLHENVTAAESSPATGLLKRGEAFEGFIKEASQRFGVEQRIIQSVIKAESDFDPEAESHAGAIGLMQLLPSTATELGVKDLYDPRENILGGTHYLAMLLNRYRGNLRMALAAYNWGPGNLEKNPSTLPNETKNYIERVMGYLETLSV